MKQKDLEKNKSKKYFVNTLRRIADAIESGENIKIQILNNKIKVPYYAETSIEYESSKGKHELELQLKWID